MAAGGVAGANGAHPEQQAASGEVAGADAREVSAADSTAPAKPSLSRARAMRENEIDLLDLLIALARRKRLIAVFGHMIVD